MDDQLIKCPYGNCPVTAQKNAADDLAVHLMERHGWVYDEATAWLRGVVEDGHSKLKPCDCEECQWAEEEMKKGNYKAKP